jgi:uncharacterized protein with PQ loop repeat
MSALLGWIGSIGFALCGIPQVVQCVRQGHARGLSPWFLGLWLLGEICYVTAVLLEFGWVAWMLTNYIANILSIILMLRYLVWPRHDR